MHALYTFAYRKASLASVWDTCPSQDVSKFPFCYLWLLWSNRWIYDEGLISMSVGDLCNLMSRAITDPTSDYRPEDVTLSVEHFVASSGVIGEAELRVFFWGLTGLERHDSSIIDDPVKLLFFVSLTRKLCQRSNLSMPKIFALLMHVQKHYGSFRNKVRLLCIFPLLHSLSLKTALIGDNTAVHVLETNLNNGLSPELDSFIDAFCSEINYYRRFLDEDASYGVVSALSVLPALIDAHLVAGQIIRRLQADNEAWWRSFQYCDEHGESAYLYPLTIFTSEYAADSPIRQKQAQLIPHLSKQLNELDSTFQLPEGPYTFKHERRAKEIMEAAFAEYVSSSATHNQPRDMVPSNSSNTTHPYAISGAIQERSSLQDPEGLVNVVIDITLPVDSERINGGAVDDQGLLEVMEQGP
jgi:hypothetical protein